eukprot:4042847-Amphidinium_carterae.1
MPPMRQLHHRGKFVQKVGTVAPLRMCFVQTDGVLRDVLFMTLVRRVCERRAKPQACSFTAIERALLQL